MDANNNAVVRERVEADIDAIDRSLDDLQGLDIPADLKAKLGDEADKFSEVFLAQSPADYGAEGLPEEGSQEGTEPKPTVH